MSAAENLPREFGRYILEENLGSGTFADVYRAQDTTLGRKVALKLLKPILVATEEYLELFKKEAKLVSWLYHPRIAPLHDFGEVGGYYYLAMRYIEGPNLAALIQQRGKLTWDEALRLTREIGEALTFAHRQKLAHGDVKPQNILIHPEEGAILTDFGLARMVAAGSVKGSLTPRGTPEYMAPELWDGKPASPASDQYALACVLVEMLTGKALFAASTPMAVMKQHSQPPRLPQVWPEGTPAGLSAVLLKALAISPAERYGSMAAFTQALQQAQEEQTRRKVVTRAPTPLPPQEVTQREAKPKHWLWIVGVAALLMIVVVAFKGIGLPAAPTPTASPTKAPLPTQAPTLTRTYTTLPPTAAPTKAPTSVPTRTPTAVPTDANIPPACTSIGQTWISPKDGMTLVCVPAGEFLMGSSDADKDAYDDEKPQHKVYLDSYWIDQTEMTNTQYQKCVSAGKCASLQKNGADNFPQIYVSWNDAKAYCEWVGRQLPTEAQWEKAARGTDGRLYPWGNQTPDNTYLNFYNNKGSTTSVKSYEKGKSPYGAYDMAGNAWEWVADWFSKTYYSSQSSWRNPVQLATGSSRVLRGGSWHSVSRDSRSARRYGFEPSVALYDIGFRCSR